MINWGDFDTDTAADPYLAHLARRAEPARIDWVCFASWLGLLLLDIACWAFVLLALGYALAALRFG